MTSIYWHVLDDGRPGHVNQSWGLVQQFDPHLHNASSSRLPAPRSWLKRPVLLLLLLAQSQPLLLRLLYKLYYRSHPPLHSPADLLISTGGDTLIANIILARLWQLPNIFLGKESRVTSRTVDLLITIAAGDSQEYQYGKADYEALADSLNELCQQQGWQLLMTTSRRTGAIAEAILRSRLEASYVAEATWYAEQPKPTAGLYSSRASIIFCSEDSGSMLTESLLYGKPVVAFHPTVRRLTPPNQNLLDRIAKHGVVTSTISALAKLRLSGLMPAQPVDYSMLTNAVQRLIETRQA